MLTFDEFPSPPPFKKQSARVLGLSGYCPVSECAVLRLDTVPQARPGSCSPPVAGLHTAPVCAGTAVVCLLMGSWVFPDFSDRGQCCGEHFCTSVATRARVPLERTQKWHCWLVHRVNVQLREIIPNCFPKWAWSLPHHSQPGRVPVDFTFSPPGA